MKTHPADLPSPSGSNWENETCHIQTPRRPVTLLVLRNEEDSYLGLIVLCSALMVIFCCALIVLGIFYYL